MIRVVVPEVDMSLHSRAHCGSLREIGRLQIGGFVVVRRDASPARIVLAELLHRPVDLVLVGVNTTENLGDDVLISSTVGAAMEAGVQGVRAIALSATPEWHQMGRRQQVDGVGRVLSDTVGQMRPGRLVANVNMHATADGETPIRDTVIAKASVFPARPVGDPGEARYAVERIVPERSRLQADDDITALYYDNMVSRSFIDPIPCST